MLFSCAGVFSLILAQSGHPMRTGTLGDSSIAQPSGTSGIPLILLSGTITAFPLQKSHLTKSAGLMGIIFPTVGSRLPIVNLSAGLALTLADRSLEKARKLDEELEGFLQSHQDEACFHTIAP